MKGGEIFVPKLPSLSMIELATTIIERATRKPRSDIIYTGIRPGEKLHEKLISKNERNVKREIDRFVVMPSYNIFSDDETFPLKVSDKSFDYTSNDAPRINIMEVI
jgi:UDP-N-acetylglucosamine 4,6-dehydratase